jgi:hypothetical protein
MLPMEPTSKPRFVRQFALTGGRARSQGADLPFETLVQATAHGREMLDTMAPDQARVVRLCAKPIAVAEISARLSIHLGIARVLVGDMGAANLVAISMPSNREDGPDLPSLERLLHELRAL